MKQLEELLNLASDEETPEQEPDINEAKQDIAEYEVVIKHTDKIDAALPMITDLEESDREMDELAKTAIAAFEDLKDLGMNVDTKYSGRIFEVAATMLGHSVTAKATKINNKLKQVDLQLKKARLDQQMSNKTPVVDAESEGTIVDRNELLAELLKKTK